ncbi:hypothetical protein ACFYY1_29070 [Streptomyces sp. NPDC001890]|uniref:hypothetical protein n=1 Tax=Streptomyces sp. NPDC001890 TaxID=3364620 RepID=UPI0036976513
MEQDERGRGSGLQGQGLVVQGLVAQGAAEEGAVVEGEAVVLVHRRLVLDHVGWRRSRGMVPLSMHQRRNG